MQEYGGYLILGGFQLLPIPINQHLLILQQIWQLREYPLLLLPPIRWNFSTLRIFLRPSQRPRHTQRRPSRDRITIFCWGSGGNLTGLTILFEVFGEGVLVGLLLGAADFAVLGGTPGTRLVAVLVNICGGFSVWGGSYVSGWHLTN